MRSLQIPGWNVTYIRSFIYFDFMFPLFWALNSETRKWNKCFFFYNGRFRTFSVIAYSNSSKTFHFSDWLPSISLLKRHSSIESFRFNKDINSIIFFQHTPTRFYWKNCLKCRWEKWLVLFFRFTLMGEYEIRLVDEEIKFFDDTGSGTPWRQLVKKKENGENIRNSIALSDSRVYDILFRWI